jgi:hypothetical protein
MDNLALCNVAGGTGHVKMSFALSAEYAQFFTSFSLRQSTQSEHIANETPSPPMLSDLRLRVGGIAVHTFRVDGGSRLNHAPCQI